MNLKLKVIVASILMLSLVLTPITVSASSHSSVNKVVKIAKSKKHCKYRHGASGPRQFDCSGFVYYVYKKSHVKVKKKIKRSSCQGMYRSLKKYKVSNKLSKAKKGDIILYKNGSRYTHTAISLGHGKIIHAANPRKGVCITKARNVRYSQVAIIRVIK